MRSVSGEGEAAARRGAADAGDAAVARDEVARDPPGVPGAPPLVGVTPLSEGSVHVREIGRLIGRAEEGWGPQEAAKCRRSVSRAPVVQNLPPLPRHGLRRCRRAAGRSTTSSCRSDWGRARTGRCSRSCGRAMDRCTRSRRSRSRRCPSARCGTPCRKSGASRGAVPLGGSL